MARRRNTDGGFGPSDAQSLLNAFFRLDPRTRMAVIGVLLVVGGIVALVLYFRQTPQTQPVQPPGIATGAGVSTGEVNLLLGNPSNATADAANRDNYLMVKKYYAISYNNSAGIPNWVSWRVAAADLGSAPRKRTFDPDSDLPSGFKRVVSQDYTGSGFDRGHMCPHSDRAANEEMSFSTFVMSNIIPQAPDVNEKAWAQMESYCRQLVSRQHERLYVISGPSGRGGRGSSGPRDVIGNGKVVVPAECWKVVVAVPESGDNDLAKINPGTRVITIVMPNDNGMGYEWARYRTSPAEVERKTGLHFFTSLSPDVAESLRRKVDTERISQARARDGEE